jgi:response regulator RpfG family c-di-GMP phosphodiesterase
MFNILIVEDDKLTSEELKTLISEEIPAARVDTAITIEEGHRHITDARETKRPYHAVILDLKLPEKKGENPEVDDTLCYDIRATMPEALIAHITAFKDDEHVSHHLETVHEKQFGNRAIRLWKLDLDYADELMETLKPFLYSQRIQKMIKDLFNRDEHSYFSTRKRHRSPRVTNISLTHELADVFREISTCWHDLDEGTQAQVQEIFSVKETGDDVTVSMFRSSPRQAVEKESITTGEE